MKNIKKLLAIICAFTMMIPFNSALGAESLLGKTILRDMDFDNCGINDDCFNRNDKNVEQYVEGNMYYYTSRGTLFTNNTGFIMYNSYKQEFHTSQILEEEGRGKVFKLINTADGTENTSAVPLDIRLGYGTEDTDFSGSTLSIEYDAKMEKNEDGVFNNASLLGIASGQPLIKNNGDNLVMSVNGYNGGGVYNTAQIFDIGVKLGEWFHVDYKIDTEFDAINSGAKLRYSITVTNKDGDSVTIGPIETTQELSVWAWNGNNYYLGLLTYGGVYYLDDIKIYTREKFQAIVSDLGQQPVDGRLKVQMNNFISESSLSNVKLEQNGTEVSEDSYDVSLSADKQSIYVNINTALDYGSNCAMNITGVSDTEGNRIADGGKITFTTEPVPPVYICGYESTLSGTTVDSPNEITVDENGILHLGIQTENRGEQKQLVLLCTVCDSSGKMVDYQFSQKILGRGHTETFGFDLPVSPELSGGNIMIYSWNGLFEMGVNQAPLTIKIR